MRSSKRSTCSTWNNSNIDLGFIFLQQPGFDIIAQFMIGYVLPGKPIANLLFKIYGRISTVHALSFLSDLKLGHYMKIPPRCMYTAQVFFISISKILYA